MNLAVLIEALILVESGGDPSAVGDSGKALGCLQIHEAVVQDVNRFYKKAFTHRDALDPAKAREICRLYLTHWQQYYLATQGKTLTDQDLARIWNGGPTGWTKYATRKYWAKVSAVLSTLSTESIGSTRS